MAGDIESKDQPFGGQPAGGMREAEFTDDAGDAVHARRSGHAGFSSLDLSRTREMLARLHEEVSFGRGRVEINRRGSDHVCIMISKAELDALEMALEILSGTAEYKSMCETLAQVAAAAGSDYVQA